MTGLEADELRRGDVLIWLDGRGGRHVCRVLAVNSIAVKVSRAGRRLWVAKSRMNRFVPPGRAAEVGCTHSFP
jgi:hypothetical protein